MSTNQTQAGYPGIQHSGNDISFAPWPAASSMRLQVFSTDAFRSSHSGSAWVTATRTVFDNMLSFDWLSVMSIFEEKVTKKTRYQRAGNAPLYIYLHLSELIMLSQPRFMSIGTDRIDVLSRWSSRWRKPPPPQTL
jgi:hypothetical protein